MRFGVAGEKEERCCGQEYVDMKKSGLLRQQSPRKGGKGGLDLSWCLSSLPTLLYEFVPFFFS